MHIKQVIIQGFKSYREQIVVEPFDKRHNVVVGRKGSGKSNFFHALLFVLSDEYSHLRPEHRLALLHEGTGPRVMSAYVEIIFDNSDNRIPIDKDEIFVRRVIDPETDQFLLNMKAVPRSEVLSLLASAGLSNSNPYYIVDQGKINQMALASECQRWKLLRAVAGASAYDESREEAVAAHKATAGLVQKINEHIQAIEERLKTLEEEKQELKEYQKWDRVRRVLKFLIHDSEHRDTERKLKDLEKMRANRCQRREQQQYADLVRRAQEHLRKSNKKLKDASKDVAAAREEKDILFIELQNLLLEKSKMELAIKDLTDEVDNDNKSKKRAEAELQRLRQQVADKERELAELKPALEDTQAREQQCARALARSRQQRQQLCAQQGRRTLLQPQFTCKRDRDRWIENELQSLHKQVKDKKDREAKLHEDLQRDGVKVMELEKRIEETTKEMERQRTAMDEHGEQYCEYNKRKDQEQNARNELWNQEKTLTEKLSSLKEDLAEADQALRSMAGKAIVSGNDSVRKVLQTFQQRGGEWADIAAQYCGTVIENFTCGKPVYTAVEVAAGNRLFHHIVESDTVGIEILKEMNNQNLPGEVTFMPLDRLQVKDMLYPKDKKAIVMLQMLKYDMKYAKAMKCIFGKTLICWNLKSAMELGKNGHMDCVTLEGEKVSSIGSLTEGSLDRSRSCLEMQKTRSGLVEQMSTLEQLLSALRRQLHDTQTSVDTSVSEMQRAETEQWKAKDMFDKVKTDIRLIKEELAMIERFRRLKECSLAQCRSSLEAMQATIAELESELHQDLVGQLSTPDQGKVDELNDAIRRLTQENMEVFSQRMNLEAAKNKLENLLTNNLIRRKDELVQAIQEISVEDRERRLSKSHLAAVEERILQINKKMKEVERKLQAAVNNEKALKLKLEKEAQEKMEADARSLEKMAWKEVLLQQKMEESLHEIAALGPRPRAPELHAKQQLPLKQLYKDLEKANQHLQKYKHVNEKALDQFISFSKEKETLYKKKEELDISCEKIRELIESLEHRKLEAIHFTLRQVSENFTEAFKKLVPHGRGSLVMKQAAEEQDNIPDLQRGDRDPFTGVGIEASFAGGEGDVREMEQLSRGQRSLVALALIFAIQKCGPAPFYLFHEIDQAFDAQHRKAIADMIHELSSSAQLITTAFRPELLQRAHKFYRVEFRDEASHVECVAQDEARDFVEDRCKWPPMT